MKRVTKLFVFLLCGIIVFLGIVSIPKKTYVVEASSSLAYQFNGKNYDETSVDEDLLELFPDENYYDNYILPQMQDNPKKIYITRNPLGACPRGLQKTYKTYKKRIKRIKNVVRSVLSVYHFSFFLCGGVFLCS